MQPLDENGRIDLYAIKELSFEFSYGKASTRQKVTAAINDAVDTLGNDTFSI